MFLLYIIFIFFTIGGVAAFLAFSISPVFFWLQHGYWNLSDPPKIILLGTCFLFFHGAIGLGGLLYLRKTSHDDPTDLPNTSPEKPWLSKTYWGQSTIESKPILTLDLIKFISRYFAFACLFPLFAIAESIKLIDYSSLIGLVFPAIALYFYLRLKKMQNYHYRYDPIPICLNPYPSFIGKKCQGSLNVSHITQDIQSSSIELRCTLHKQARDDYDQETLWHEKTILCKSTSSKQTQSPTEKIMTFCFDLKHGLKEAQAAEEYPFISWQIKLELILDDDSRIKREYNNIPIFKQSAI